MKVVVKITVCDGDGTPVVERNAQLDIGYKLPSAPMWHTYHQPILSAMCDGVCAEVARGISDLSRASKEEQP